MQIEPKNLNIPLHRKDRLGVILVGACVAVAAGTWLVDASFGYAFIAACVVVLPLLCMAVFPPKVLRGDANGSSRFGLLGVAILLVYIGLSKSVLLPQLLKWLHAFGSA